MTSSILKVFQSTLNSAYIMSEDMNPMDVMKAFKLTLSLQEHLFETMMQMLSLTNHSMKASQFNYECSCKLNPTKSFSSQNLISNEQSTSADQTLVFNSYEDATIYQDSNSCVTSESQSTCKLPDNEKAIQIDSSEPELATTSDVVIYNSNVCPVKQEVVIEDDSTNDSFITSVHYPSTPATKMHKPASSLLNRHSREMKPLIKSYSGLSLPFHGRRLRNQERIGQQYRRYDRSKLDEATRLVLSGKMTAYKASLQFRIPCSTIHDAYVRLKNSMNNDQSAS